VRKEGLAVSFVYFIQQNFMKISLPASGSQILASGDSCYHPPRLVAQRLTWPLSTTFLPLQMDHPKSRMIYLDSSLIVPSSVHGVKPLTNRIRKRITI
jgi:hypothetical protein